MKPQKQYNKVPQIKTRVNNQIKASQVMLINEDGKNIGMQPFSEAIRMAKQ